MATIASLADRLRSEIGDTPKSFVYTFTTDGTTNRFLVPYSPLDGANLIVNKNGIEISADVEVEEATGYLVFDDVPANGDDIIVAGNYFRYFTTTEVQSYINIAFLEHSAFHTDAYGRSVSLQNIPTLEEYPVVVYASTLALYALANDAAFDINVFAPDGVTIPRSERYQQLMQMIQTRKEQYKELCSQLGIGMFKIDVFSFRRISKTTNHYVPIFQPQEIDDRSAATRVHLPTPTYGNVETPVSVVTQDLFVYEGDAYEFTIVLDFEVDTYTAKSEILGVGIPGVIATFTITFPNVGTADGAGLRTLKLALTGTQTRMLPSTSYYDVQLTKDGVTHTYVRGKIFKTEEVTE